jgi:hypothetical protein
MNIDSSYIHARNTLSLYLYFWAQADS